MRSGLALLRSALLLFGMGCGGAPEPGPDVLLVTIDTLRADFLSTYGMSPETSPEIDALAAGGVVFERAVAAAAKTAPAHAAIMTSRFTREHSIGYRNGSSTLVGLPTLAERFSAGGYATGAFVGNILLARQVGLDRGFETYDDELTTPERNRPQVVERVARETTERAVAWLTGKVGPAFLWVHYQDPHGPYTPPPGDEDRFRFAPALDEQALPRRADNSGRAGIPAYQYLDGLRRPSEYVGRYAGEIFYADRWFGTLLRAVEEHAGERGLVVLVTADHGESLGEGGQWFTHTHTTTPDVARVPFVLRAPGLVPSRHRGLVHHVDVAPTLLDLAGLEPLEDPRGLALASWIRAETPLPQRPLYCDNGNEVSAYTGDGFVRMRGAGGAWQSPGEATPSHWQEFRWEADGSWSATGRQVDLPPTVRRYTGTAVPVQALPAPTPDEIEQLRALGYGR